MGTLKMERAGTYGEAVLLQRAARRPARAALEIAFVVSCVLIAEWAVIPIFGRNKRIGMIPIAVVLLFSLLAHRSRGENARDIGFSRHGFFAAFRMLLVWMIPAIIFLVLLGWLLGSLHFNHPLDLRSLALSQVLLYLWGMMQQYALQAVVNRRAQDIWGKGTRSVLFSALLFSALHLPNLWLALTTFCGGVLWAAVYQRRPNLYALALSHSIMTTVLSSTISSDVLHGMRVGYNYF